MRLTPQQQEERQGGLRRRFLHAVKGREALLEREALVLVVLPSDQPPSLHTCFNRLDFPFDPSLDETEFREALTALVSVEDQSFNES